MKQVFLCLLAFSLLMQCKSSQDLTTTLEAEYERHFISSGNNFPEISLQKKDRYKFLVGLHNKFNQKQLQEKLGWTNEELQTEITLLKENGYLKSVNGKLFPTISIVMQHEGKKMFQQSEKVAQIIAESIIKINPNIESEFQKMDIAKSENYADFKFFLFSDVLLDNWQINQVESDFLKKKRTLRHGKRYYIQYAEKNPAMEREVFGIYGNQYRCNDSACYITYGNNRKNHKASLEELAKMPMPFLSRSDQNILENMAKIYQPTLIKILNENKAQFLKNYQQSVFQNEISFEEYFIWYYHFLYTRVTDILAEKKEITIPKTGIFRLKLEK